MTTYSSEAPTLTLSGICTSMVTLGECFAVSGMLGKGIDCEMVEGSDCGAGTNACGPLDAGVEITGSGAALIASGFGSAGAFDSTVIRGGDMPAGMGSAFGGVACGKKSGGGAGSLAAADRTPFVGGGPNMVCAARVSGRMPLGWGVARGAESWAPTTDMPITPAAAQAGTEIHNGRKRMVVPHRVPTAALPRKPQRLLAVPHQLVVSPAVPGT